MSKHKNVNPDHYKSGTQGEDIDQEEHRKKLAREKAELERWQERERERQRESKDDQGGEKE